MNETITNAPVIGQPFEGGTYIGLTIRNNTPMHLILLPEQFVGTWKQSLAWAKKLDAQLPTRMDLLAMWNNAREGLEGWIWSCEEVASHPEYAWYQYFYDGTQSYGYKVSELRARAVRRVPIR
jgi:hypothetical protein